MRASRHLTSFIAAIFGAASIAAAAPVPPATPTAADIREIVRAESVFVEDFSIVFPQDPTVTHFDDTWGHARSGGRRHKGNDLMAPKMSPVYAIADGVVTIMRRSGMAGRWIAIEHAGGYESWYMHLNNDTPGTDNGRADPVNTYAPGIELGAFVGAGQLIGYVGDSGNAEHSGAHTHFELHQNGSPIDPHVLLEAAHERALEILRVQRLAEVLAVVD